MKATHVEVQATDPRDFAGQTDFSSLPILQSKAEDELCDQCWGIRGAASREDQGCCQDGCCEESKAREISTTETRPGTPSFPIRWVQYFTQVQSKTYVSLFRRNQIGFDGFATNRLEAKWADRFVSSIKSTFVGESAVSGCGHNDLDSCS
jgi:hypothetical protein